MFKSLFLLFITLTASMAGNCQQKTDTVKFRLQDIINIAREHSTASLQATTLRENRYWQWKTFMSNYKPQLTLDGSLPTFSKTNIPVIQPDGSIAFRSVINDNSVVNLNLTQNISSTGGQLFVSSNLLRSSDFNKNITTYNGNPLVVGFNQPLFAFNQLAWDKKIEPLIYEESQRKFVQDIEEVGKNAASLFFNLLIAQINRDIAQKNLANNETLYRIGEMKASLGKISRNDQLQLKLGLLNARKSVVQANLDAETSMLELKSFIGFTSTNALELFLPDDLIKIDVNVDTAIYQARNNRQQAIGFKRSLLEAEKEVAKVKGENGLRANLVGTFGLTNVANNIPGLYKNPKDQEVISIGFQMPIIDWGRGASKIKTAEANRKLIAYTVKQAQIDFDQQIYTLVRQLRTIKDQMQTTIEADTTAEERYIIANKRYILGDLSITDLNIAMTEKDQARRDYILSLKSFWDAYYSVRVFTLYDFVLKQKIKNL